jgi:hypothetical protein
MELAECFGAKALNYAVPGSRTDQLDEQILNLITSVDPHRTPAGELDPRTLVVIHTAGNDFMQRLGADLAERLPGQAEADTIRRALETLYSSGVRHFIVADVPFASCVPGVRMATPIIQGLVTSGKMAHLGLETTDTAELAVELQATALHDQWAEMLEEFKKDRTDAIVVHFDEAFALTRLREEVGTLEFDSRFFDFTLIHPSAYGHHLLAREAHKAMGLVC